MMHKTFPNPSVESSPVAFRLPADLQLLFVGAEEPSWTALTLELDRYGCPQPHFRWCSTLAEGTQLMSRERFDCIIIDDVTGVDADTGEQPPLAEQLAAIRAAGCSDPLLVLCDRVDDAWLIAAASDDFELLTTPGGWRSRALVPWIHAALHRRRVLGDRDESGPENQQRHQRDCGESWQLLDQRKATAQRLLGRKDRKLSSSGPANEPHRMHSEYRALLRTSVVAGAGALSAETLRFTRNVVEQGLTASEMLSLHVEIVESLLRGLGSRSSRHVIQQTDLVVLEVLCLLAERPDGLNLRHVDDRGLDLSGDWENSKSVR